MVDNRRANEFLDALTSHDLPDVFNPWRQNCDRFDTIESKYIRLQNLGLVIERCLQLEQVDLWIGRDLGWRGGRRTGVAFVDEINIEKYGQSLGIGSLQKATIGKPIQERTATEISNALERVSGNVFFWNVFPYHPHEKDDPFTNRMHTTSERKIGGDLLLKLISTINFRSIIAVGNDASAMVKKIGIDCHCVRHPSYGGKKKFHSQIDSCYNIKPLQSTQTSLFDDSSVLSI